MRGAGTIAAFLVFVAMAVAVAPPSAAKSPPPPTNAAVFDSVAGQVAGEILAPGGIPQGRAIEIIPPVVGDTLSMFEQRVLQRLRADGWNVRVVMPGGVDPQTGAPVVAGTPAAGALRLGLSVESKSVLYTRRVGKFPMGVKGYERQVTLSAQGRLVDPATGDVLWARTGSKQSIDFVKAKDVRGAASGTGLFSPGLPSGAPFGFLEPILVTGVVVGLVVLFYSNRT